MNNFIIGSPQKNENEIEKLEKRNLEIMINLINVKNRKDISFWELKNDILKAMERGI